MLHFLPVHFVSFLFMRGWYIPPSLFDLCSVLQKCKITNTSRLQDRLANGARHDREFGPPAEPQLFTGPHPTSRRRVSCHGSSDPVDFEPVKHPSRASRLDVDEEDISRLDDSEAQRVLDVLAGRGQLHLEVAGLHRPHRPTLHGVPDGQIISHQGNRSTDSDGNKPVAMRMRAGGARRFIKRGVTTQARVHTHPWSAL